MERKEEKRNKYRKKRGNRRQVGRGEASKGEVNNLWRKKEKGRIKWEGRKEWMQEGRKEQEADRKTREKGEVKKAERKGRETK